MPRVSQDAFLNELTKLLEKSKEKKSGSVQLSFKRCPVEDKVDKSESKQEKKEKKTKKLAADHEYVCLAHARLGAKKVSTSVPSKDHIKFQQQFSLIMKVHLDGLKKKEKKKKEKVAPTAAR